MSSMIRSLAFGVAIAVSSVATAISAEKVIFAFPTAINSGVAPMALAMELGYFEKEGLEPEIVVLQGSSILIPQLMSGQIFTGFNSLEPLPISRQPGKPDFKFKYVYNYIRSSMWELAVLGDSPIKTTKDLAGKTIGVGAIQWGNVPSTKAIVQHSGIDPALVQWVGVGSGVPAFEALRRGRIDALNLNEIMNAELEEQGTKIRRLELPAEYGKVSSHGFPVTDKMIKERPDLVAKFGRVMTKGTIACAANTEACIRAYWRLYPAQKPSDDRGGSVERAARVLRARIANLTAFRDGEPKKFGAFAPIDWTSMIDALKTGGQIDPNVQVDTSSLYTNEFVDEYNTFDAEQVVNEAKNYAR